AGGLMTLDVEAAERAVAVVAERLGVDVVTTAAGLPPVVNPRPAPPDRLVADKRGHAPRGVAPGLLGGAGPPARAAPAQEMGMAEVLVPEAPGVLAAFGLLGAAIEHQHARTLEAPTTNLDLELVNRCLRELDTAGQARMRDEDVPVSTVDVGYAADMRYVGQAYELEVPITAPLTAEGVERALTAFHAVHARGYGYERHQQQVKCVNYRAVHRHPLPSPVVRPATRAVGTVGGALTGERRAYFGSGFVATAVYDRAMLPPGADVPGPAIVEQPDTA